VFTEKIQGKLYSISNVILKESFEVRKKCEEKLNEFQKGLSVVNPSVSGELV
jgi:hypothetical protein